VHNLLFADQMIGKPEDTNPIRRKADEAIGTSSQDFGVAALPLAGVNVIRAPFVGALEWEGNLGNSSRNVP